MGEVKYFISLANDYLKSFIIDYVAGSIGGLFLTISAHPFDIPDERRMLKSLKQCYRNEGIFGFYKGMGFPTASVPFIYATVFSVNEVSKVLFNFRDENSFIEGTITGSIAGFFNSLVATPVELVKCRLQVQKDSYSNSKYKGILDCLKQTYKFDGVRGIYKGNFATIVRDIAAYGGQFGSYYFSKNFISNYFEKGKELNNLSLMAAGSISGVFCWTISTPQDVIKTHLQLDYEGTQFKKHKFIPDGGFIDCSKYLIRTYGWQGMFKGYVPQTYQAIVGNAFMMLTYEKSKSFFS